MALRVLLFLLAVLALVVFLVWWRLLAMPGRSLRGPLPGLSEEERALVPELRAAVEKLAGEIGPRSVFEPEALGAARTWIRDQLATTGRPLEEQVFQVEGQEVANLAIEVAGSGGADEVVVIGAHYDTCGPTPGADDNASGIAGLLALARRFAEHPAPVTLRLVAFVNEEPPFFKGEAMGSLVYAKACVGRGERLRGMVSLEMLGDFRDEPGSQEYPPGLGLVLPSAGDYIGFVGTHASRAWIRELVGAFRRHATLPSEGVAGPAAVPGIDWSDHWSFQQVGVPALMVTDGGPYRNDRYHQTSDTPDTLDYERMARVVLGLERALREL